ncbi:MAG: diguanylate cyclase domain-containing protein [Acidobacteriaceae bacterium]
MFNFRTLPDLLALTVLVFVFWSILRRRAGEQLHAWLLGWIFILLHFAVQLFSGGPGGLQTCAMALSAMMLELAGASFIYAAGAGKSTRRMSWVASTGLVATLLYIVFLYAGIVGGEFYYAAVALLAASVVAVLFPDAGRPAGERNLYASFGLGLVLVLAFLVHVNRQEYGLEAIFFAIYGMAGIQYWRNFPHRSTGCFTAVVGLIAWALVFPISVLMAIERPDVHIQDSVWNIPKYIVAIGILLTLLEDQINRTEHLALHDPLTGLPNRRLLEDRLMKAIERAERNEARVAVLLVDLDSFKQINDTYGHPAGDEVLKIVATRLQMRVRKADTIARAGGDEFLVVVSDLLQPQGATVLAAKINADLNEPIVLGDIVLRAGASIGVAVYPDDADTAEALCAKADASMYAQKRRSK